jgi:hypothetical protein
MIERRTSHPAADIIPKKFLGPRNGSYRDHIQEDRFMQLKSPRSAQRNELQSSAMSSSRPRSLRSFA